MAKKRKTKNSESKTFQYGVELTGLILILVGLIGFGFGPVGAIIKKFAMFLVGEWWPLILLIILFLGIYMIVKRQLPKFFTSRLFGFYILFIVILTLLHFTFIENAIESKDIFKNTLSNYTDRIASMGDGGAILSSGQSNIPIGGGIIGAAFAFAFSAFFGMTGTIIVVSILTLFGVIMLFDITLSDIALKIKNFFAMFKKEKKPKEIAEEDDDEVDDKIIITSVEELKEKEPDEVLKEATDASMEYKNDYKLPPLTILDEPKREGKGYSTEFLKATKTQLETVLSDFGIKGTVTEIHPGPAVSQFEIAIPSGTKVKTISNIHNEIKLALAAKEIRIQAPIPGKSTVGVEVPNPKISEVRIKEILENIPKNDNGNIVVSLGKDIMGRVQTADLSKMPHLLVAGSTGSGKSVCINSIIISILMKYRPDEVKLMLIDPKQVELSNYNGVPHLICPVVTDPKKASLSLQKVVGEMEKRYNLFSETGVKNIGAYNAYIEKQNKKNPNNLIKPLPYMVAIIDELADLMLIAAKEVEDSIMRITQMARAAGIHLIVATQRPSTDVITGVVKANIPSRISFAVASGIDSRTILNSVGAERLLGKGDMLYLPMGENSTIRIQGSFVSDDEIKRVIEYVSKEQAVKYDEEIMNTNTHMAGANSEREEYDDPLYNEIVEFAVKTGKISASLLQRRFRLGYNRAARIVDLLEERGIIGPANGSKPREVLVKLEENKEE